ncbi:hypothetical protein SAMN05444166_2041 [Singulisphaera sp. GP187]|uniref:hypothetical protein n=1 Tax=Singulisphaera sp. GP187 TaxID=1882752 RepID=UPI0009283CF6|nr:hypothetical protein [Singulisphaera sp. GP187]SIO01426.1 hypothetical protein SAMN05444166_2041 [Singulisphaera sp. GP187]
MPPRLVCIAILLFWVVGASSLIRRDVLPELGFVRPPDLRTIASAEEAAEPSSWSVEVIDNPLSPETRRIVGTAATSSSRNPDGGFEMSSTVSFNAGGLLRGTPLSNDSDTRLDVVSHYQIDPSGNLQSFTASVRSAVDSEDMLTISGTRHKRTLKVVSRGQLPIFNQTRTLDYEPRSLVQNALGPFDRLPGLQVGQKWETQMVSPFTGRIETVGVDVSRRCVIHWDNSPVTVFEVVHHMTPLSSRTWVRTDGLVVRQEVPFPLVKLVLERIPGRRTPPGLEVPGR